MSDRAAPSPSFPPLFASSALMLCALLGCGGATAPPLETPDHDGPSALAQPVVVNPGVQSGFILVRSPAGASLPDWVPPSPLQFPFAQSGFLVFAGNSLVAEGRFDVPLAVPRGSYRLTLNDTHTNVSVRANETTEVGAARVEVADVAGTFRVLAASDAHTAHGGCNIVLEGRLPTGTGLNVFAGSYRAQVSYQTHVRVLDAAVASGHTVTVRPGDLRGSILVVPPAATLPDWKPAAAPQFPYDNRTFSVINGGSREFAATGTLGEPVTVPEGTYRLVLNDTIHEVTVVPLTTTTVYARRVDVRTTDQSGTFRLLTPNDRLTAHGGCNIVLEAAVPLGNGLNVFPGKYTVSIRYDFGGTDSFPLDLPNAPEP